MMKIGIDMQSTVGRKTGIGYYAASLMEHFPEDPGISICGYRDNAREDMNTARRIYWENVGLMKKACADNVDILHIPGFSGPWRRGKFRKITTVCDLIGMIFPENMGPASRFYWSRWLPGCVKRSDMIIAISEHTRKDIVRLLDIPPENIRVILLAADPRFRPIKDTDRLHKVKAKYGLPDRFILNVGTIEPRKNISALVEAFSGYIKRSGGDIDLVLSGKKGWAYEDVRKKVSDLGVSESVRFAGYIEEEDLPVVYNLADFFVYPSVYEGFGLPVLEALSCGLPVLCSDASSLPEVVGDAGILISPYDIDGWVKGIELLDTDPRVRKELSVKGLDRAGKFSWRETAENTLEVYKEVLKGPGITG